MLFGHEKGAYTNADQAREGLILQANGGTLFLDEIGEMPLSLQRIFLRVLQEHRFRPLGSNRELESDFRLVAATNRNLLEIQHRSNSYTTFALCFYFWVLQDLSYKDHLRPSSLRRLHP